MTDNVRKVFDILGVEPFEKFKIKGNGIFENEFYFDERLWGYLVNNGKVDILSQILNGTYEIIKLPKKKKLRDLTVEEYKEWCDDNKCCRCYGSNNSKCIFMNVPCNFPLRDCWIYHKDLYSDKFLDQEIEVE